MGCFGLQTELAAIRAGALMGAKASILQRNSGKGIVLGLGVSCHHVSLVGFAMNQLFSLGKGGSIKIGTRPVDPELLHHPGNTSG